MESLFDLLFPPKTLIRPEWVLAIYFSILFVAHLVVVHQISERSLRRNFLFCLKHWSIFIVIGCLSMTASSLLLTGPHGQPSEFVARVALSVSLAVFLAIDLIMTRNFSGDVAHRNILFAAVCVIDVVATFLFANILWLFVRSLSQLPA